MRIALPFSQLRPRRWLALLLALGLAFSAAPLHGMNTSAKLAAPGPALSRDEANIKVPGPSPRQTIERFAGLTARAEERVRRAVHRGMAEPGLFFSLAVHQEVDQAVAELQQATQALDLSQVPVALRPMTGVGTLLMLRSLLLHDLDQNPGLVIPDTAAPAGKNSGRWSLPESILSLAPLPEGNPGGDPACALCTPGDYLFTADTLARVPAQFEQLFGGEGHLNHRYGSDLYAYWALLPGGALPPKPFLQLPLSVRRFLLLPIAGQSLLQWLLLLPVTLAAGGLLVGWLVHLRRWLVQPRFQGGLWPHLLGLLLLLPPWLLVGLWQSYAIDWINLIGPWEAAVLVGTRLLSGLIQGLLVILMAETTGQLLIQQRHTDGSGLVVQSRRKGAGQILTLARTAGIVGALAVGIQTAQALGLTSLTLLAVSSVPALAISLGTQQLIRDIADGFSLWLDGQIRTGERCTIDTSRSTRLEGLVCSLGMRSVRLQEDDGTILSIPNSLVAGSVVADQRLRRGKPLKLSVPLASTSPTAVAASLRQARQWLAEQEDLSEGEASLDTVDNSWCLSLRGRWREGLTTAERRRAEERLMLVLLAPSDPAEAP